MQKSFMTGRLDYKSPVQEISLDEAWLVRRRRSKSRGHYITLDACLYFKKAREPFDHSHYFEKHDVVASSEMRYSWPVSLPVGDVVS